MQIFWQGKVCRLFLENYHKIVILLNWPLYTTQKTLGRGHGITVTNTFYFWNTIRTKEKLCKQALEIQFRLPSTAKRMNHFLFGKLRPLKQARREQSAKITSGTVDETFVKDSKYCPPLG